jgi:hypothetical protein
MTEVAGDALVWDGTNSRWTNGIPLHTVTDLEDVSGAEAAGDVLYYTGSLWTPTALDITMIDQLGDELNSKLDLSGGTMTGALDIGDYAGSDSGIYFNPASAQTSWKTPGTYGTGTTVLIAEHDGVTKFRVQADGQMTHVNSITSQGNVTAADNVYAQNGFLTGNLTLGTYNASSTTTSGLSLEQGTGTMRAQTPAASSSSAAQATGYHGTAQNWYIQAAGTATFAGKVSCGDSSDPTSNSHLTRKAYVDGITNLLAPLAAPTFTGLVNGYQMFLSSTLTLGAAFASTNPYFRLYGEQGLIESNCTTAQGNTQKAYRLRQQGTERIVFYANGDADFDGELKSNNMIDLAELQAEVAASTDFADFQSRIASMTAHS